MTTGPARIDTAEALLDAAERLFSEKGYAAVGVREIVDHAGVNIAAIKYHFGSKSELYLATVRRAMQRRQGTAAWEVLDPVPRDRADAAVALVRFVRSFLEHLLLPGHGDGCNRLLLREAAQPSEAIDAVVRDYIRPNERLVTAVLRIFEPHADERRLSLLAESIIGQVLHYRVFRPFLERMPIGELTTPEQVSVVADHIGRFTLGGLGCLPGEIEQALDRAKTTGTRKHS